METYNIKQFFTEDVSKFNIGDVVTDTDPNTAIGFIVNTAPLTLMSISVVDYDGKLKYSEALYMFKGVSGGVEKAKEIVAKYHTESTKQGDWKLPTIADMQNIKKNFDILEEAIHQFKVQSFYDGNDIMWDATLGLASAIKDGTYFLNDNDNAYIFENENLIYPSSMYLAVLPILKR